MDFFYQKNHGSFRVVIHASKSNHSIILTTLNAEVQLLRQLMSGKDNRAKVDDSLETYHLAVGCDVGQLTFQARFWACYTWL